MAAPKGNQFWKVRSSHGRKPIFETPEKLWDACSEYFEWVEAHPLKSAELVTFQGTGTLVDVPKMRAMTLDGLYIFLDIDRTTWSDYCKREDFISVTTRVDRIIRTQKFEGASAGFLNANIIARDLGLADKTEITGKDGGAIEVDDRAEGRRVAFLLAKAAQQAD